VDRVSSEPAVSAAPPTPHPVAPGADRSAARRAFLSAALRRPGRIGAVYPSSPRLAGVLASVVPSQGEPTVVELGPGTGSVSTIISARLPAGARHLAVELDPDMAAYLRRAHPGLEVVSGDAKELTTLLAARSAHRVDAVISGLPWSLFGADGQREILEQVSDAIGDEGAFTTFAYTHTLAMSGARGFRKLLHESFDEVLISRTVWRNVPPAYTYVCRRPRG
jgi:phosphatidylethanolamine/phosphatidyl-N-methylethanolamine N-methyltransferase